MFSAISKSEEASTLTLASFSWRADSIGDLEFETPERQVSLHLTAARAIHSLDMFAGEAIRFADGTRLLPDNAFRRPLFRLGCGGFAEPKPKPFD